MLSTSFLLRWMSFLTPIIINRTTISKRINAMQPISKASSTLVTIQFVFTPKSQRTNMPIAKLVIVIASSNNDSTKLADILDFLFCFLHIDCCSFIAKVMLKDTQNEHLIPVFDTTANIWMCYTLLFFTIFHSVVALPLHIARYYCMVIKKTFSAIKNKHKKELTVALDVYNIYFFIVI